jgi:Uma2 family endonuclease
MAFPQRHQWTEEEYLAFESEHPLRHEFVGGEVYDMAGASEQHVSITGNIVTALNIQVRQRPCKVYANDLRLKITQLHGYVYPDVMMVCDKRQFDANDNNMLLNPTIIIEVLSASTQLYDKTTKFELYRTIDSLQGYLLISQDKVRVEHFVRQTQFGWLLNDYGQLSDVIALESVNCQLALADIYDKVEIP